MKRILLSIMLLCLGGCAAMPVHEGGTPYRRTMAIPDRTRDQIFDRSRTWLVRQFGATRYPVDYENRADGIIVVAGSIPRPLGVVNPFGGGSVDFTLREEIGGGEVRLTCDRFTVVDPPEHNLLSGANAGGEYHLRFRGDMDLVRERLTELTDDLARFLKNGPPE